MSNPFEKSTIKKLMKERDIKENSAMSYIRSLRKLNGSSEPLSSLSFLKDFKAVSEAVDREGKLTSKKTKLIAAMATAKVAYPDEKELHTKMANKLKEYDVKYMEFLKTQTKTPTQKKNWVSYGELQKALADIKADLRSRGILSRTEDEGLSRREYDDLQKYITLMTYLTFPMRNDIADMKAIKESQYNNLSEKERKNNNYLVEHNRTKRKFHINVFKNSKRLGSKVFDIPPELNKVIKHFMQFNKSGYFITLSDRETPISPNALSQLLSRISKDHFDKRVSSSMIRHITATHLDEGKPSIEQKEKEEKKIQDTFMHSSKMNELYVKKD
jgi:hypothetical protein